MPAVTVVVPHWNRWDLLGSLLKRLREQTHPIDSVVVVDNGSDDGSADYAEQAGARVLRLDRNYGFSRAVNLGISEARTEYVAILNNDVIPERGWLAALLSALEAEGRQAWFSCGKLYAAGVESVLDGTFDLLSRGGCAWRAGHGRPDSEQWGQQRRISLAPLTAAVFRTELFERVGLLEEGFESYLEDVELGLRCAVAGYGGLFVPEACAVHAGSATLGRWHPDTVRKIARNQLFLIARHYPPGWFARYGWPVLVGQGLWGLVALRHGAGKAWLRGKWEGVRGFRAWRPEQPAPADRIGKILQSEELELKTLQQQFGFDYFWRFYFALTW